jgi:hypothetical protein
MGQVCAKHSEFYEEVCRWCEPVKAEGPAAAPPLIPGAPAAPPLVITKIVLVCDAMCPLPATWRWTATPGTPSANGPGRWHYCQGHHDNIAVPANTSNGWTWERLP